MTSLRHANCTGQEKDPPVLQGMGSLFFFIGAKELLLRKERPVCLMGGYVPNEGANYLLT